MSEKSEKHTRRRRKIRLTDHLVCVRGEGEEQEKLIVLDPRNVTIEVQKDGDKIVHNQKWDQVVYFTATGDGTELG